MSTGSSEASRFARYAFRRHFFQHAGFRVVKSTENAPVRLCNCEVFVLGVGVEENPVLLPVCEKKSWVPSTNNQFQFEVESYLNKLLEEQYGEGNEMTNSLIAYYESVAGKYGCGKANALHLGCGPGYTSLMLSKTFDLVAGVDYCGRFVNTAMQIQNNGVVKFGTKKEARLPDGVKPKNVNFVQLTWLPNEVENHDFVLVEFLDRVLSPKSWLVKLWECISSDGIMVSCTSNKWKVTTLSAEVGKWFEVVESSVQGDKLVTVWKMKN